MSFYIFFEVEITLPKTLTDWFDFWTSKHKSFLRFCHVIISFSRKKYPKNQITPPVWQIIINWNTTNHNNKCIMIQKRFNFISSFYDRALTKINMHIKYIPAYIFSYLKKCLPHHLHHLFQLCLLEYSYHLIFFWRSLLTVNYNYYLTLAHHYQSIIIITILIAQLYKNPSQVAAYYSAFCIFSIVPFNKLESVSWSM